MTLRSAVVVGAAPAEGGLTHYAEVLRAAEFVIAADGGLALCREAGRLPDVIVGDLDSASAADVEDAVSRGCRLVKASRRKNETDLELAVALARAEGVTSLKVIAAFCGRADHTLAAFGTLTAAADLAATACEPCWTAHAAAAGKRPTVELGEPSGTTISIVAVGDGATVTTEGLEYSASSLRLAPLSGHGISNVAVSEQQRVTVSEGTVVVIVAHGGAPSL